MSDKHCIIEEPDEVKVSRPVLKTNGVGDNLVEFNKGMVKNHCLAQSISDVGWYQFRVWLEYFGKVFGRVTIAVSPAYTSQECSNRGTVVKKSLSTRTHICRCGCELDRDHNAAINILNKGLGTVGHTGTFALDASNAPRDLTSILVGENLPG